MPQMYGLIESLETNPNIRLNNPLGASLLVLFFTYLKLSLGARPYVTRRSHNTTQTTATTLK